MYIEVDGSHEAAVANAEQCIRLYSDHSKRAYARGDVLRGRGYGERATMWIQRLDAIGGCLDGRSTAFSIGTTRSVGNVRQVA